MPHTGHGGWTHGSAARESLPHDDAPPDEDRPLPPRTSPERTRVAPCRPRPTRAVRPQRIRRRARGTLLIRGGRLLLPRPGVRLPSSTRLRPLRATPADPKPNTHGTPPIRAYACRPPRVRDRYRPPHLARSRTHTAPHPSGTDAYCSPLPLVRAYAYRPPTRPRPLQATPADPKPNTHGTAPHPGRTPAPPPRSPEADTSRPPLTRCRADRSAPAPRSRHPRAPSEPPVRPSARRRAPPRCPAVPGPMPAPSAHPGVGRPPASGGPRP